MSINKKECRYIHIYLSATRHANRDGDYRLSLVERAINELPKLEQASVTGEQWRTGQVKGV